MAHDPGISTAQAQVRGLRLNITAGFAPDDANYFLPSGVRTDDRWSDTNFEGVRGPLLTAAPDLWSVQVGQTTLSAREVSVQLLPGDNVSFQVTFLLPEGTKRIVLRAPKLGDLPSDHRQFVIVSDEAGSTITKKLLRASDATLEVSLETERSSAGADGEQGSSAGSASEGVTFWGFLKLGMEHIWTGYDHLLFLFALLVVCRSFRSIVAIISCFTVAHSLTLAMATFDFVNLPARWVEPTIAASIVFVGVENLLRRGAEPRGRWALTFAFGLIHGFGFAGILRDLGIGRGTGSIGMPLFSFNLGVEIGQIIVAIVVLPLIWQLKKREGFVRRGVPALSSLVALAGLYWLIERTVFA